MNDYTRPGGITTTSSTSASYGKGEPRKRRRRAPRGRDSRAHSAVAGGAYAATRPANEVHVVTPPDHDTTSTVPAPSAGRRLFIGESVLLGARTELARTIPGAEVDAVVSRQFDQITVIIDSHKAQGALPRRLSSTSVRTARSARRVRSHRWRRSVRSRPCISSRSRSRGHGSRPERGVAVRREQVAERPRARLARPRESHPEWFVTDGFHLTDAGPACVRHVRARRGSRRPRRPPTRSWAGRFPRRASSSSTTRRAAPRRSRLVVANAVRRHGQRSARFPVAIGDDVLNAGRPVLVADKTRGSASHVARSAPAPTTGPDARRPRRTPTSASRCAEFATASNCSATASWSAAARAWSQLARRGRRSRPRGTAARPLGLGRAFARRSLGARRMVG